MKYPACFALALTLTVAAPAQAQALASLPRAVRKAATVDRPVLAIPPTPCGMLAKLLSWFRPQNQHGAHPRHEAEAWTRFSRQKTDSGANLEYDVRGIVSTAVLSAGAVGLTLVSKSPHAPQLAIKPCRAGAMIGVRLSF